MNSFSELTSHSLGSVALLVWYKFRKYCCDIRNASQIICKRFKFAGATISVNNVCLHNSAENEQILAYVHKTIQNEIKRYMPSIPPDIRHSKHVNQFSRQKRDRLKAKYARESKRQSQLRRLGKFTSETVNKTSKQMFKRWRKHEFLLVSHQLWSTMIDTPVVFLETIDFISERNFIFVVPTICLSTHVDNSWLSFKRVPIAECLFLTQIKNI